MANILITEFMDEAQVELLSVNHNVTYDPELYKNSKTLLKEASNTHALIVRNKTNVDKKLLDSMKHLKVVGRLGVGLDNIDVDFCDAIAGDSTAVVRLPFCSVQLLDSCCIHCLSSSSREWKLKSDAEGFMSCGSSFTCFATVSTIAFGWCSVTVDV